MNDSLPELDQAERDALVTLGRRRRLLVIIIPERIPDAEIQDLSRTVNRRLDELAQARDRRST